MPVPFIKECSSVLARTPGALDALLRGLPDVWTEANEGPSTWSPYVVIGHLIHCEKADWMPRLAIILEHGTSRPFDPVDREAQLRHGDQKPLACLLDEFSQLRTASLQHLHTLDLQAEYLEKQGTHPTFGAVTARQLLATWTAHDLAHILQISRIMAKRLKPEVGPWAQFLSVMK
jgi:hypothetical protein